MTNPIVKVKILYKRDWRHSEDQMCAKWSPHITDNSLFPKYSVEPINSNDHIQGPCSDNSDMGLHVYQNTLQGQMPM